MKHILSIIAFAFLSIASRAQEFDQPISQTKFLVENEDLGSFGEDCIWSLKDAELQKLPEKSFYYISDSDSTLLIKEEDHTQNLYSRLNDELYIAGLENKLTKIIYDQKELYVKKNLEYGDSICGVFSGHGLYSDKVQLSVNGTYTTVVDGAGCLVLPENKTIEDVLRVTTVRKIENIGKTFIIKENRWIKRNHLLPVIERTEISCNNVSLGSITYYTPANGFSEETTSKQKSKQEKHSATPNVANRLNKSQEEIFFSINKNSQESSPTISFDISEKTSSISYEIYTLDGVRVYHSDAMTLHKGHYEKSLPILHRSNYIVNFIIDDKHYAKKVQF